MLTTLVLVEVSFAQARAVVGEAMGTLYQPDLFPSMILVEDMVMGVVVWFGLVLVSVRK